MLKIWGRADSGNVQKVTWAAGELGLPFERVDIGGPFGKLEEPAYKKLNPNSRIPTIEDDGFVLWESNAIVRYLALKHGKGKLCPADLKVRADADRWMDWCTTVFLPQMIPVFLGIVKTPPEKRDMKAIEEARALGSVGGAAQRCARGQALCCRRGFQHGRHPARGLRPSLVQHPHAARRHAERGGVVRALEAATGFSRACGEDCGVTITNTINLV